MGFSFSGIREELDSKELGKLYRRLQADCRYLAPFADWKAVVAFLHDQKRGYRLKDRIVLPDLRAKDIGRRQKPPANEAAAVA